MNTNYKKALGFVVALGLVVASSASAASAPMTFSRNLSKGATGADVKQLQQFLNSCTDTQLSSAAGTAGSAGFETMYFGPATVNAVKAYQTKNGIAPVLGNFFALTRAAAASVGNVCGGTTPTPPSSNQTGPITVSLASTNPASTYIMSGQSGAKLADFTFSGNGTVNSITLMRNGLSDQNTLSNVYLYDGATRLTTGYSFNTTGMITMNNLNLMVNGSKTISVRADVTPSTALVSTPAGQTIAVALTSVMAAGQTTASTVNLVGNTMSISNGYGILAAANFTTAGAVSPVATSVNSGTVNQNLWSRTLSVSTRALSLQGLTVKMIGSAPANTIGNAKLFVDGSEKATATINAMNQFVFVPSSSVNLSTGSHLIEVRGDVVGGAFRNFYLSLEQGTDVMLSDSQLGVNVTATSLGLTAVNLNGGLVTVNQGSLTINQDVAFNNTTTLVGGASQSKLSAYKFTAYGEDVKVTSLSFMPTFTGLLAGITPGTTLANVGLYVNGGQVGSNQIATTGSPVTFNNLGSNLLVAVGTPVVVEIKGDVMSSANANYTEGTIKFDLQSGSSNAQGMTSSQLTSTSASGGQSLTVASSNVNFASTTGFAASTQAPNQAGVKIGSFTVQTGSAEGIMLNNIAVNIAGSMQPANQITNLTVKDGSTVVGTPIGNPILGLNNFSASIPVAVSTTKVLDVYADFGSSSAGLTVTPSMQLTYNGATSNLSSTSALAAGITVTANVATIAATGTTFVPASSPVAQLVIGGNSNLGIATFNIKTSNSVGGATIKDMTFTVPANTIASVTVNGKTASVVGTTATIYDAGVSIASNASGTNIPVSVALVCVNASGGCSGVSNLPVTLQLTSFTFNNGSTIVTSTPAPVAVSATHKLVATKPTVTVAQSSTTGFSNGVIKIGEVTISADAAGELKMEQLPVDITVAGVGAITAGTVELRDSAGTAVITGVAPINGTGNFVFSTPRGIAAGTSETYSVYATFTGVSGAAGTQSVTFHTGPKASFLWTDVIGNVAGIDGTNINSYSTNSQTKTN